MNKNRIPPYLHKRKIELLKEKILLRKYAYLYYRKVISNVLISTSQKHYKISTLKKPFLKLKLNWHAERVEWRLLLRANIHYSSTLKGNKFHKWKCYIVKRKQKKLKQQIVDYFYCKKIKYKYFIYLRHIPNFNARERLIIQTAQTYNIFAFLYINTLKIHCNYFRSCIIYFVNRLHYKAFKKRTLRHYFKILQIHAEKQKLKIHHNELIKLYRQVKYKPRLLLMTFNRWICFTRNSMDNKLKIDSANRLFSNKLKLKYLILLHNHSVIKMRRRSEKKLAGMYFENCLLQKFLKLWLKYKNSKIIKDNNTHMAYDFYNRKLKERCFKKLLYYKNWRISKSAMYVKIDLKLTMKTKKKYLTILQDYHKLNLMQKANYAKACAFCTEKLMKKYMDLLHTYKQCRCTKRELRKNLIMNVIQKQTLRIYEKNFSRWNVYVKLRKQKQLKITLTEMQYSNKLLFKTVTIWKDFVNDKKLSVIHTDRARIHFDLLLKRRMYNRLKIYADEEKCCKLKIEEAKLLHRNQLMRNGIKVILAAASKMYNRKQKCAFKEYQRQYFLALKFFKIWKHKVCVSNYVHIAPTKSDCVVSLDYVPFQWNPICFAKPKVPKYLAEIINK